MRTILAKNITKTMTVSELPQGTTFRYVIGSQVIYMKCEGGSNAVRLHDGLFFMSEDTDVIIVEGVFVENYEPTNG